MKLHILKIERKYFFDIMFKNKKFELRKDDRGFKVGDLIHFVNVDGTEIPDYSHAVFKIGYILRDVPQYGLDKDYCVMQIYRLNNSQCLDMED
jgi:hypothetical protein